jgi:hypothetical protein
MRGAPAAIEKIPSASDSGRVAIQALEITALE